MLRDAIRRLLGLPTLAQYQALVSDNRDSGRRRATLGGDMAVVWEAV